MSRFEGANIYKSLLRRTGSAGVEVRNGMVEVSILS